MLVLDGENTEASRSRVEGRGGVRNPASPPLCAKAVGNPPRVSSEVNNAAIVFMRYRLAPQIAAVARPVSSCKLCRSRLGLFVIVANAVAPSPFPPSARRKYNPGAVRNGHTPVPLRVGNDHISAKMYVHASSLPSVTLPPPYKPPKLGQTTLFTSSLHAFDHVEELKGCSLCFCVSRSCSPAPYPSLPCPPLLPNQITHSSVFPALVSVLLPTTCLVVGLLSPVVNLLHLYLSAAHEESGFTAEDPDQARVGDPNAKPPVTTAVTMSTPPEDTITRCVLVSAVTFSSTLVNSEFHLPSLLYPPHLPEPPPNTFLRAQYSLTWTTLSPPTPPS